MKCTEAKTRWHCRFDEAIPDAELDAHLAACAECRVYDTQMRRQMALLAALRKDTDSLTAAPVISASPHRPTVWSRTLRVGALAASVALLFLANSLGPRSTVTPRIIQQTANEPSPAPIAAPPVGLSLRGQSATQLLAVAAPSTDPNVQIFWLYPRLDAVATPEPNSQPSHDPPSQPIPPYQGGT
jgi:anti-sigma factor RsiW